MTVYRKYVHGLNTLRTINMVAHRANFETISKTLIGTGICTAANYAWKLLNFEIINQLFLLASLHTTQRFNETAGYYKIKKNILFVFLFTSTKITKLHTHWACNASHVDLQVRCFPVVTSIQKIRDIHVSSHAQNSWRTCPALTLLWSTYLKKLYQMQRLFSYPNIIMEIKSRMVRADT